MADTEDLELDEIQRRITDLHLEAKSLTQKGRKRVLAKIVKYMSDFDITLRDIEQAATRPAQMLRSSSQGRPKYEDPDTGQTWTGRGKAPKWLLDKEAHGVSRESFLVERTRAE